MILTFGIVNYQREYAIEPRWQASRRFNHAQKSQTMKTLSDTLVLKHVELVIQNFVLA